MSSSIKQAVEELKRAREELATFKQDTPQMTTKDVCAHGLVILELDNARKQYQQKYTLRVEESSILGTFNHFIYKAEDIVTIGSITSSPAHQCKLDLLRKQAARRVQEFTDDLDFLSASLAEDIHNILSEQKAITAPTFQFLEKQEALKNNVTQAINNLAGAHQGYIREECWKFLKQRFLRSPHLAFVILDSNSMPRKTEGVYLIWEKDKLLYVGQSQDIRQRLRSTHHVFDRNKHWVGAILESDKGDRLYMETVLIHVLNPPENKQQRPFSLALMGQP